LKAIIPIILLFSAFCSHESFGQKTRWITKFEDGDVSVFGTSCSKAGNIYVTAQFRHSFKIGNDTLIESPAYNNNYSGFLACLSPDSGKILWTTQITGKGAGGGFYFIPVADDSGNCYIYGNANSQSIAFGKDTVIREVSASTWDAMAKYGPNGKFFWAKKYNTSANSVIAAVANPHGGLYVLVNQSKLFQINGKGMNDPYGNEKIYLLNISSQGSLLWYKEIASNCFLNADGNSFSIDKNGFLYIDGSFGGDLKFGSLEITGTNFGDYFIAKADTLGNQVWVKDVAEGGKYFSLLVSINGADRISVAGNYMDSIRLDNNRFIPITPLLKHDFNGQFVSQVDSMGKYTWAKDVSVPLINYTLDDMQTDRKGFTYLWEHPNTTTNQYPAFLDVYDKDGKENMNTLVPIQESILALDSGDNMIMSGQGVGNSTLFGTPNNVADSDAFVASVDFGLVYKPDTIPKDTIKKDTLAKSSTLQLYPNPVAAYGTMFLKDDAGFGSGTSGNIYDVFGRRLTSFAIPVNTTEYKIQVSDWAPAMYFLDINTGTQRRVFKFIVQ